MAGRGRGGRRRRAVRGRRRRGNISTRRSIAPPTTRITVMPPALDIQSDIFTTWLRRSFGWGTASHVYTSAFTGQSIFRYHKSLAAAFSQYRLLRANVWFLPDQGTDSSGQYAMTLTDGPQEIVGSNTFTSLLSAPGSVCRKRFQIGAVSWRPTEPSDRDWHDTEDASQIVFSLICVDSLSGGSGSTDGNFVMDYRVQMRGYRGPDDFRRVCRNLLPEFEACVSPRVSDFEHIDTPSIVEMDEGKEDE